MKLLHADESSWEVSELSQTIWNFLQFKEIQTHSSILHVMQIQHADNASDRKNNHDILNIDSDARHMSELSVIMKWACKKNAEQNENSNQCASSHYNIHLKSHISNSVLHIQHSNQISLDTWSHNLTHEFRCEQVRNNTLKLQEWAD